MRWNFFGRPQPRKAVRGASFRPALEALEDRFLMDANPIASVPPGTNSFRLASQTLQNIQQAVSQEIQTFQQIQQQMIQAEEQQFQQLAANVDGWVTWYTDQNGVSIGIPPQVPASSASSADPNASGNGTSSNPGNQSSGFPIGTYVGTTLPSFGSDQLINLTQTIGVTINSNNTATVSIPGFPGGFSHTLAVTITQNGDGSWNVQGADASVDTFQLTISGNQATANIEVLQNGLVAAYNGTDDPPAPFILNKQ